MSKVFYRKQFSDYLGEQRAIDDIVVQFIPDGGITPTPTPVPVTPTPTPTKTSTPTPTPSITPSVTSTLTPTPTKTGTPTPTPTRTPAPACDITYTELPSPTPSNTPTTTPTNTPTVTPTASPAVAWTPANIIGLNDWWTPSSGVVLSGLNVDSWTGYNGKLFTPYNASNKATYSASDVNWNNQPSITINPTNAGGEWGYKAPTNLTTPSTISSFVVARNNNLSADKPLFMIWNNTGAPNSRIATLWNTDGGNTLWGYTDGMGHNTNYTSLGVNDTAPSYVFNEMIYVPSSTLLEWYASNTSILGSVKKQLTSASSSIVLNELQLGTYFGILGSLTFSVVDVISVNGIISPSDLTNLQNYINTKYGI